MDLRCLAPCSWANRDNLERIDYIKQSLGVLNNDVVPAHEDKLRVRNRKLLPI